jgi:two-component system chemotaxis response regulator CheB
MNRRNLLIIGSSTGGPSALQRLFHVLDPLEGAIVVVQHLPEYITDSIADALTRQSQWTFEVAQTGMSLDHGRAFLAPGGKHLTIQPDRKLNLSDGAEVNFVKPSVDVTMLSIQAGVFDRIVAVILTGMGRDGAEGIVHLKKMGAITMAQNSESCSVFGMPKMAIETNHVDFILTPESIAYKINEIFKAAG